jgi:O-antigen ligase
LALLQFILQWFVGLDTLLTFWQKSLLPFFLGPAFGSTVGQYSSLLVNVHGLTLLRATALFPDPHIAAYYFGMTLPLALALAASHPHQRRLWYSAASLLFIADILTFSRGGALGLLCGGLFWGYARLPRLTPKHLRALIFTFLFLLGLILSPIGSRFLSSFSLTEGSNQGRLAMWQAASTLILTHPWLGVGLGNFPLAVLPSASYRLPIYAHSLPLDIMAESGLGAGLCYFLLLFFTLRSLLRLAHHNAFFFGPATSLIIFTVHSFFENPLYSVHILPLLILCLAVSTFSPAKISSHA